jgi:hypothetical protein
VAIRGLSDDKIKDVPVAGCYRHMPPLQITYLIARKRFSGHYVDKIQGLYALKLIVLSSSLKNIGSQKRAVANKILRLQWFPNIPVATFYTFDFELNFLLVVPTRYYFSRVCTLVVPRANGTGSLGLRATSPLFLRTSRQMLAHYS